MYKSKLQELCQQNSWNLPIYTTIKDGFDHNPRFKVAVTVNGLSFETADQTRTAKEAQNNAAKLAFDHFTAAPIPPQRSTTAPLPKSSSPGFDQFSVAVPSLPQPSQQIMAPIPPSSSVVRHLYKNRLQTYAQKRNITLPEYSNEREGPPHASRFKSKVSIEGKTYESPGFFQTIKEAEHAVAEVAWKSLCVNDVQEDDSILYKNLLQELAQKEGFGVPKYETTVSGPPHIPIFVSAVELGGKSFQGQEAKSKKQAEMNAAKIAYIGLQGQPQNKDKDKAGCGEPLVIRKQELKIKDEDTAGCSEPLVIRKPGGVSLNPTVFPSGFQIKEALKVSSSILQSVITDDMQQSDTPKGNLVICKEKDQEYIGGNEEKLSSKLTTANAEVNTHDAPVPPPDADISAKRHRSSSPSSDIIYATLRDPFPSTYSSPEDGGVSSSCTHSEFSNTFVDSTDEPPVGAGRTNTLPQENILIFPRVPNMKYPDGATELPFSDDKWVALKMNSSQVTTNRKL